MEENQKKGITDEERFEDEFNALFESVIFNYYLRIDSELEEGEVWEVNQLSSSLNKFIEAHNKIKSLREKD